MELRINLFSKICNRRREPPPRGLIQEEINRDNGKNHKKNGEGERNCSRALLSAFSSHLPPLRRIRSRTDPNETSRSAPTNTRTAILPTPIPRTRAKENRHHIHPLRIFKLFSASLGNVS